MRRLLIGLLAGGCLTVGLSVPSQAETIHIPDGRDAAAAGAVQELLGLRVKHEKRVTVVMRFSSNYMLHGESPYGISYDTKPGRKGAEFFFSSHFGAVFTVRHGDLINEVPCAIGGEFNRIKHSLRISIAHQCLRGDDGPVRVRVATTALAGPGSPLITDYSPGRHRWSEPVSQG